MWKMWHGQVFTEKKQSVIYLIDWVRAQKVSLDFAAPPPTRRGRPLTQFGLTVPEDLLVSPSNTRLALG